MSRLVCMIMIMDLIACRLFDFFTGAACGMQIT